MKSCFKNNTLTIYINYLLCSIPPLIKTKSEFFNLSAKNIPVSTPKTTNHVLRLLPVWILHVLHYFFLANPSHSYLDLWNHFTFYVFKSWSTTDIKKKINLINWEMKDEENER